MVFHFSGKDVMLRKNKLLYTGSMPRSVFMQIMHENHEFACAKINAIDFVCINCCWNEVRVNSNKNKTFLSKPLALSFIRCYNTIMIYSA